MSDSSPSIEQILNQATILPIELPPLPEPPVGFIKVTPVSELAGVYVREKKVHSVLVKPSDLPLLAADGGTLAKPSVMLMIESPEINKVLNVIVEEDIDTVIKALNEARISDISQ